MPSALILRQLVREKCLAQCQVCKQFCLNNPALKRESKCPLEELAPHVNKTKEMLLSLDAVPALPSKLLQKIGDFGAKKTMDTAVIIQNCVGVSFAIIFVEIFVRMNSFN